MALFLVQHGLAWLIQMKLKLTQNRDREAAAAILEWEYMEDVDKLTDEDLLRAGMKVHQNVEGHPRREGLRRKFLIISFWVTMAIAVSFITMGVLFLSKGSVYTASAAWYIFGLPFMTIGIILVVMATVELHWRWDVGYMISARLTPKKKKKRGKPVEEEDEAARPEVGTFEGQPLREPGSTDKDYL
jgi:hypothetical protein